MPYVRIISYGAGFDVHPFNDEQEQEITKLSGEEWLAAQAYVQQSVIDAYQRHCDEHDAWNTLWRTLSNQTRKAINALESTP